VPPTVPLAFSGTVRRLNWHMAKSVEWSHTLLTTTPTASIVGEVASFGIKEVPINDTDRHVVMYARVCTQLGLTITRISVDFIFAHMHYSCIVTF
jgi:hypothetical protein